MALSQEQQKRVKDRKEQGSISPKIRLNVISPGGHAISFNGNYIRYSYPDELMGQEKEVPQVNKNKAAVLAQGVPGALLAKAFPEGTTGFAYHEYKVGDLTVRAVAHVSGGAFECGLPYCAQCGAATSAGEPHTAWCGSVVTTDSDSDVAAAAAAYIPKSEPTKASK